jgi:S-DNA-T family DNA segregation ATPase FtsK/SpoIIIE
MLESMGRLGWATTLITPRRSPLREFEGLPGVRGVFSGDADADEVQSRMDECTGRRALVIDDLELIDPDSMLATMISDYVSKFRDTGDLVIAAGGVEELDGMYRGPVVDIKRSRCGVLLAPDSASRGDLLGVRLPPSVATAANPAGRGILALGGTWELIQVAHS